MIESAGGHLSADLLAGVFDLVDKGPIGPITGLWFGNTLNHPNRNKVFQCPITELNTLINALRKRGDLGLLGEWREASKRNRGMDTGMATLLLYLHAPERFNVWLPKLHSGLSRLCELAQFPRSQKSPESYRTNYRVFNENAVAVRDENKLDPHSVDWFLFAVDELIVKPSNVGLRALIEIGSAER